MKILKYPRRYRFPQATLDLLEKIKPFHNESKFVRESIIEKFNRDYPKLIKEQEEKSECPF